MWTDPRTPQIWSTKRRQPRLLRLRLLGRRVITAIMGCFTVDGIMARWAVMDPSLIVTAPVATSARHPIMDLTAAVALANIITACRAATIAAGGTTNAAKILFVGRT